MSYLNRFFITLVLGLLAVAMFIAHAHAAPLNFATAENASLLSPTTTLTIATNSAADALKVTTSSILATLSSSTGGSFTLLSPSYDLTVATSSGGGTVTISCSSGVESAVISQTSGSTVYTITTAGTTCASSAPPVISNISTSGITTSAASVSWTTNIAATTTIEYGTTSSYGSTVNDTNPTTGDSVTLSGLSANTTYHFAIIANGNGTSTTSIDNTFTTSAASSGGGGGGSSGGGGGGGGGGFYIPPATGGSTSASSSSTVSAAGANLLAELLQLVQQVRSLSLTMFFSANNGRNLTVGSKGQDVWAIQVYLITNNILNPTGSAGSKLTNPTGYFGALTKNALAEYQATAGISPASGLLGQKTGAYLRSLAGGSASAQATTSLSESSSSTPASQPSLSFGSQGPEVTTVQNILVQDGFLSSGVFTQGTFDIPTERAVDTFQCTQNIICSGPGYGTVGPKTRAALGI